MAAVAHLERMGRELKCPICLSLLNSAVSLTCNHVFCNSCIAISMKSVSECPVCKVPYQRREVRLASHMDNLVNIYKSMEVASGVNMPVTQTDPLTKLSGEEKKLEGKRDKKERKCKGTSKRKMSKKSLKNTSRNSRENLVKPSFPAKKRVQVPQHPELETPTRPQKLENGKIEQTKDGTHSSSPKTKERTLSNESVETIFAPFFWLRNEKDPDKLSQPTDEDQVTCTPPDAPCFSDMKDSDSEKDCDNEPMSALRSVSDNADIFDSEMFEWTQRPCSPELYSSPMKMQETECKGNSYDVEVDRQHTVEEGVNASSDKASTVPTALSCGANRRNSEVKTKRAMKRASKASGSTQRKKIKRITDKESEIHNNLQNGAGPDMQKKKIGNKYEALNLKETICKRVKNVTFNTCTEPMTVKVCTLSNKGETSNQGGNAVVIDQSNIIDLEQCGNANHQKKLTAMKETSARNSRDRGKRSKAQNIGNSNDILQLPSTCLVLDDEIRLPKCCPKTKENVVKNLKFQKCSKRVKFSTNDNSKVKVIKSIQGEVKENSNVRAEDDASETEKVPARSSEILLRKCDAASSIQCAFCQSTDGSNVSGIMVHYLKGMPVAADYKGGLGIIHAHRDCAEWAPNVYFEDDTAINLEAELSRSRRIKCCCCGLKGAALGCYEKICRRSFHYPCAKLTPECRWDNENFVMLCPLHKSLALPSEASGSQLKHKKKYGLKRQSHIPQSQVAASFGPSTTSQCYSKGLFKKMVISCSALTGEDKETVREFEKLSGVTVLKAWDSSVTHVITSTDENGASRRTLKFLMGILEGKWIVNIEWVKACMKVREPVSEQDYEIDFDVHGIKDGPRLGRLRLLNKEPKLLSGYKFYFTGEFVASYRGYLHDLIIAAGGTVLHRKPIPLDQEPQSMAGSVQTQTFIIYSLELPDGCSPNKNSIILRNRLFGAETLAKSTGASAISNKWILNSIAACKLQNLPE